LKELVRWGGLEDWKIERLEDWKIEKLKVGK
jgi:hypothetical protein